MIWVLKTENIENGGDRELPFFFVCEEEEKGRV